MKTSPPFVSDYWARLHTGERLSYRKLRGRDQLSPTERLIAALLRSDRKTCEDLLSGKDGPSIVTRMIHEGAGASLIALLNQRVYDLELQDRIMVADSLQGRIALDSLRTGAVAAALMFAEFNERFLELLSLLSDYALDVVYLKGTALARTLYERPHFRLSRDFDLVVKPQAVEGVIDALVEGGLKVIWDKPGYCHQFGVGPVGSVAALCLTPCSDFEQFHNLTLEKEQWPLVELKSNPLDLGLKMLEPERFFAEAKTFKWEGASFLVPGIVDHLLLQLTHLHKHGFDGWLWLEDIDLLVRDLSGNEKSWKEFLRRAQTEGIVESTHAGLDFARERLGSAVPAEVLEELKALAGGKQSTLFTFSVNPEFIWNSTSLPMLLLSACFLGDKRRKLDAIKRCFLPDREFIESYYGKHSRFPGLPYGMKLMLHWLVLVFPGGVIRRTFGWFYWPRPDRQAQ